MGDGAAGGVVSQTGSGGPEECERERSRGRPLSSFAQGRGSRAEKRIERRPSVVWRATALDGHTKTRDDIIMFTSPLARELQTRNIIYYDDDV